jgi:homoserine O-acetyltransferase/O-succinyltransferase
MASQILNFKELKLESGTVLSDFSLAYETFGNYDSEKNNVVWVCHALTANADVFDWWKGLFGNNDFFNPKDYFIVCVNMLGSCYGSEQAITYAIKNNLNPLDFPLFTIRDIVKSLELLRNHLRIKKIKYLIGGSMGGQQALEWAYLQPLLFENLVVLATNARHSAWGIAFNEAQRLAIKADQTFGSLAENAGEKGLKAARACALLSYRNYEMFVKMQTDEDEKTENFKAISYQQYQGEKLVKRFNAYSYWYLSKAMDSHHIGRNRGSMEEVLKTIKAKTLVIGISSDLLFPIEEQQFIADNIPTAKLVIFDSAYGHDGFLIETQKIANAIQQYF